MQSLNSYGQDGASAQARAVLAYLGDQDAGIEASWRDDWRRYEEDTVLQEILG